MKNPYTYDPKTDAPIHIREPRSLKVSDTLILKAKMQEFLETLDDEDWDERYGTQRGYAASALEKFYNFINKQ